MSKKDMRYRIIFLRHAESVGNAEGYFQGQDDFPLTERGREQANALAARWFKEKRKFDYAISSPLSRTRETAEIVAEKLQLDLEFDPIWMERHNGAVTGLKHAEGRKRFPEPAFRNPYADFAKNGEGDWALFLRAGQALKKILSRKPGRYLIVSHGGLLNQTIKAIVGVAPHANYQGPQFRFGNTAFAQLTYFSDAHRWYVEGLNDQNHWRNHDE
ncbi:MAG: histidine phosphatase family protein [Anaerolineae bacterium]|jgi:broad specificity phosphatase PhoE|nr:histidine phosphatase family protein [Anaerolineae bacterium]MBT7069849.1 histidine phosphatase family protein [Anaerolineae bacterium]MBT7324688.1 histidine phosphatase family protein [Anaerolineae bacterium]